MSVTPLPPPLPLLLLPAPLASLPGLAPTKAAAARMGVASVPCAGRDWAIRPSRTGAASTPSAAGRQDCKLIRLLLRQAN